MPQMHSWDTDQPGRDARAEATRLFCERLDADANERKACTEPTDAGRRRAKEVFAELGGFYLQGDPNCPAGTKAIPNETVFRVYEYDPPDRRDELVTIVLPQGATPKPGDFVASDYYRCTYWPW